MLSQSAKAGLASISLLHRYVVAAILTIVTLFLLLQHQDSFSISTDYNLLLDKSSVLLDITNRTLGKILAINLPERTDHRDGLLLAAAVSNLSITFIDGVHGDNVPEKVLPPGHTPNIPPANIGSWRAHMNAIARVVENNYASALIIEDDVDWDISIRSQLRDFAVSSNAVSQEYFVDRGENEMSLEDVQYARFVEKPTRSPYGDEWDLLWLGHCEMLLPSQGLRVLNYDDETAAQKQYLTYWNGSSAPLAKYPEHTRVVAPTQKATCSLAYAVSQKGARKILYDIGLKTMKAPFDLSMSKWCEGNEALEYERHNCVGVIPTLFDHFRPVGSVFADSDISEPALDEGEVGYREKAMSNNIRWSTRVNLGRLIDGEIQELVDQYPDVP